MVDPSAGAFTLRGGGPQVCFSGSINPHTLPPVRRKLLTSGELGCRREQTVPGI
jgi:hypothetical protein